MTKEKNDSDKPIPDDKQFLIAVAFIAGFFILLIVSLAHYFISNNLEAVKEVGTLFGGWVGAIIGFYFGQRPVEQVRQTLKDERDRTKDLTDYIKQRSDAMWQKLESRRGRTETEQETK